MVVYRSVSDESAVKAYGALALPAVESFGGRFLTRSTSQIQTHEAGLQLRTILVEFDSYETALVLMKARHTRRRFGHSVPERSATFASSRVRKAP